MHDLSQFMNGVQRVQAEIDEMGLGDPLKKENAALRRQLENLRAENEQIRGANQRGAEQAFKLIEELAKCRNDIDRWRDLLGSIDGMYQFLADDGAVTEKPKLTWEEFGRWVYEIIGEALKED